MAEHDDPLLGEAWQVLSDLRRLHQKISVRFCDSHPQMRDDLRIAVTYIDRTYTGLERMFGIADEEEP